MRQPLSPREAGVAFPAVAFGLVALVLNADYFLFDGTLLPWKDSPRDRPPVRTALPNLCSSVPADQVAKAVTSPRVESYKLDRNDVSCSWATSQHGVNSTLSIYAARPAGADSDVEAARRTYQSRLESLGRDGNLQPVSGLGDEARMVTQPRDYEGQTELAIRDGLLVIQLRLRTDQTAKKGATTPEQDAATVKQLAITLLRILPPKGR